MPIIMFTEIVGINTSAVAQISVMFLNLNNKLPAKIKNTALTEKKYTHLYGINNNI